VQTLRSFGVPLRKDLALVLAAWIGNVAGDARTQIQGGRLIPYYWSVRRGFFHDYAGTFMSERGKEFAETWVSKSVHNEPLAYGDDYDPHVQGLLDGLLADASNAGIEKEELESAIGDPEDYVAADFERVFDPAAGLIRD
jgi:hypothetical protein